MLENLKFQVVSLLCRVQVRLRDPEEAKQEEEAKAKGQQEQAEEERMKEEAKQYAGLHIGRNDPCPCGSGKKFKNCHGRYVE